MKIDNNMLLEQSDIYKFPTMQLIQLLGENSLQAVYQQLKMVEREIQFMVDQIEMFDLFPVIKPVDHIDPDSGLSDDTWLHPCKVTMYCFFVNYIFG